MRFSSAKRPKKSDSLQLHAVKNYFITCPNVTDPQPLDFYLEKIKNHLSYPQIRGLIIAHEEHQTGVAHFNLVLSFHKKKAIYKKDVFNYIFDKQVNLQPARDLKAVVQYVIKAGKYRIDGVPLTSPKKASPPVREDFRTKIIDYINTPSRRPTDLKAISSKGTNAVMYSDASKLDT